MSGGQLAVLDRAGREVKRYALPDGRATLGSGSSCDIRFMLPTVKPHHATVVVHDNQTVVHNMGGGQTLVNGAAVSVAALAHGDVLAVGGRELRWRYTHPSGQAAHSSLTPVVARLSGVRARVAARRSLAAPARPPRSPHRNSTPASARQVAVVQPQRRDAADMVVSVVTNVRRRGALKSEGDTSSNKSEEARGRSKAAKTPQMNLQNTTKAAMWIESRKTSPRRQMRRSAGAAGKSAPLRLALLRRALSAPRVTKIRAPLTVDHTKQAAIMLMTGHTPKKRASPRASGAKTTALVVKRPGATPARRPARAPPLSGTPAQVSRVEVTDATPRSVIGSDISTYSVPDSSPPSPNPKKSALKNSSLNRSTRKIETINFDLSNFEDGASASADMSIASKDGDELSLRYSDSSPDSRAPSSARPAHSRGGRMLEKTLGAAFTRDRPRGASLPPPPPPTDRNKSTRGSMMVHKVLQTPEGSCSHRTTGSPTDVSWDTAAPSRRDTTTSNPRLSSKGNNKIESYSVIDLVSMDSSDPRSVYSSAFDASTSKLGSSRRSTRSLGAPRLLASSTPAAPPRPRSAAASRTSDCLHSSSCLFVSRRSNSAADCPRDKPHDVTYNISGRARARSPLDIENIPEITLNGTKNTRPRNTPPYHGKQSVTRGKDTTEFSSLNNTTDAFNISDKLRGTKSLSMLKDSSENVTSNTTSDSRISQSSRGRVSVDDTSPVSVASSSRRRHRSPNGMSTPANHNSPEEASTPVLNIQSLLNASRNMSRSRLSRGVATGRSSARKTIGCRLSTLRNRADLNSQSFTYGTTAVARSRNANDAWSSHYRDVDLPRHHVDSTPTKAVKLVYEAVKDKHSTAKRPKSIKSVIDDLNNSDIVKELFNSPVKRKLSQSMIEFGKKQLVDEETSSPRKATRNTIALTGITSCDSSLEHTPAVTPDVFVSPLSLSSGDRRVLSLKLRRWRESDADTGAVHDAHNATGSRRSKHSTFVENDLSNVSGIKSLFARSPMNRLSEVRIVKNLYEASPGNDLRRIPKLRLLFQESPENDLRNVSGVRELYRKRSPADDQCDVSGVRATMRRHSPRNDLDDVSGVAQLFGERNEADADTSFDLLMGRPAIRAYPKAKSFTTKLIQKPKTRKAHSLLNSFSLINDDVDNWLENELRKRTHKEYSRDAAESDASARNTNTAPRRTPRNNLNKSKIEANLPRELLRLATDTVQGGSPVLARRGRSAALAKTSLLEVKKSASEIYGEHTLPIKKRSVVETSRGRSGHKSSLPIKKRALQHSTPVRRAAAHRAAPTPRVSPITPLHGDVTPTEIPKERVKRKRLQIRNAAADRFSPKLQQNIISPMPMRSTRSRKAEQNNATQRRTCIVATKKPAGLSPVPAAAEPLTPQITQPATRTTRRRKLDKVDQEILPTKVTTARGKRLRKENEANHNKVNGTKGRNADTQKHSASEKPTPSPLTTRTKRRRKASAERVQTPKKMTRTKVLRHAVVVTKPSPNVKTGAAKRSKVVSALSPVKNLRTTRKTNTKNPPAEIGNERLRRGEASARARNKITTAINNSASDNSDPLPKKRRGTKTIAQNNVQDKSKANRVRLVVNKDNRGEAAPQRALEPPKTRAANKDEKRKAADEESGESGRRGAQRKPRKTRDTAETAVPAATARRGRPRNISKGGEASAPRRRRTAKRASSGAASRVSKDPAPQKTMTRKRANADAAAAEAGPAPKTRRAAAAPRAPRTPRAAPHSARAAPRTPRAGARKQ